MEEIMKTLFHNHIQRFVVKQSLQCDCDFVLLHNQVKILAALWHFNVFNKKQTKKYQNTDCKMDQIMKSGMRWWGR